MNGPLHVCVIGAGILGACCALELLRDGHRVTIIEPGEPGGEQAASYGNGCFISPGSVIPMSVPGLWRKAPGYLLDADGPLTLRWSALPALAPWLWRFLRAGSSLPKVRATARALAPLLREGPERHRRLAAEMGREDLIASRGLLYAYPDRQAFEAESWAWQIRRENGISWDELDRGNLGQKAPGLATTYRFAAYLPEGAHCLDPGAYVSALVRHAMSLGASLRRDAAQGFKIERGQLRAVRTQQGVLPCDVAVVAAGHQSAALARGVGDRVLLESERGYHVAVSVANFELPIPVMTSDTKTANVSTRHGFRVAGQVELAAPGAAPDWRRADILWRQARQRFAALPAQPTEAQLKRWMGNRPSTPDGLPVLGASAACAGLFHAFGHGHVGLASAPASARLVADLISGKNAAVDPAPYSIRRFS